MERCINMSILPKFIYIQSVSSIIPAGFFLVSLDTKAS